MYVVHQLHCGAFREGMPHRSCAFVDVMSSVMCCTRATEAEDAPASAHSTVGAHVHCDLQNVHVFSLTC